MEKSDIIVGIIVVIICCGLYYYCVYLPAQRLDTFLKMSALEQAAYLPTIEKIIANNLVSKLSLLQLVLLYRVSNLNVEQSIVVGTALSSLSVDKQKALYDALTGYSVPGLLVYSDLQAGNVVNSLCPEGLVVNSVESAYYKPDNQGGVPPIGSCKPLDVSKNPAITKWVGKNNSVTYADLGSVFTDPCPKYTKSLVANYTCGAPLSAAVKKMGPQIGANAITTSKCGGNTSDKCS
jgi:hypothetical protein